MVNDVLFFVGIVKGDRARYPFKLRGKPLVTIPIVVADIKETKPKSISATAVFLCRPIL